MRQFDVVKNPFGRSARERPFFVVLQSNPVDETRTVVVAPLVALSLVKAPNKLYPRIDVGKQSFVLATHELAAAPRSAFGKPIASVADVESRIKAALDLLLYGV